ncbi:MAG: DUF362 domain-containing protein [Candidatus Sericytochromatia bacterium]|uniref:DUF362 domain-containing protein n=1 Tax=Candidatus Tanganyikabacteria bacterium TaxID=2961651 RepID=A0A937X7U8_9BACT|nr:DUF362 domain-containing protein [Candidatus Tanganyikabacteria bacterium]
MSALVDPEVFVAYSSPEYLCMPFGTRGDPVLEALTRLWDLWGRDPDNPFQGWVGRGGSVLLKPNWVLHANPNGHDIESLVTHSSLLFHIADFAAIAMQGEGILVIGDAPLQGCKFETLMARARVPEMIEALKSRHPKLQVHVEDWRLTLMGGGTESHRWGPDRSQGEREDYEARFARDYDLVDLGPTSFLEDIAEYSDRFRVTQYKPSRMKAHHAPGRHEYLVTSRVRTSDLVINVPKMKTHIKAGLTGAMKNLVGINGHKEYLPHHIRGSHAEGGDCYDRPNALRSLFDEAYDRFWERFAELPQGARILGHVALSLLWRASNLVARESTSAGSWSQNETIWRTTLDLNHILYFRDCSPRRVLTVVDGIVAGEGEGPLEPVPKPAGLLVAGFNPAYVDAVLAQLMGYNVSRIPTVYHAVYHRKSRFAGPSLEDFNVRLSDKSGKRREVPIRNLDDLRFEKPRYWRRAERPYRPRIEDEAHPALARS